MGAPVIGLLARSFDSDAPPLRGRTKIGACSADDKAAEITAKLEVYFRFLNDPSLTGRPGYPDSRASWPDINGNPTDAWNSPLAHRTFFEWWANGAKCIDVASIKNLLFAIGVDQTLCGADVAEALAHSMDKGADDGCVTWPEYLNSRFSVGPASDTKAPDPTEPSTTSGKGLLHFPSDLLGPPKPLTLKFPPGLLDSATPDAAASSSPVSTPVLVAGGVGLGVLLLMLLL